MSIAQSLYTWLTANSAIEAYVSDRIYPHYIPQHSTARPCLTYSQEGGEQIRHLSGVSDTRISEFALDTWSNSYLEAQNLAETVITELGGVRGSFGSHTAEQVRFLNKFDVEPEPDTGLYRVSMRFEIVYY